MIVVMKPNAPSSAMNELKTKIESVGIKVEVIFGTDCAIMGLLGDTSKVDKAFIEHHEWVEKIMPVLEPFKMANRKFQTDNTVINVNGRTIGGKKLAIIAGPCSVESREQIVSIAEDVKKMGATFLRGGAFKPRTSPYAFQGLRLGGLELLKEAKEATGLPIVTELTSILYLDLFVRDVDIIQVGARNMQNFELLKELGRCGKPILLKRGMSSTVEELLMAAEYIMSEGNKDVILCERGIRTFETATRGTLDLSAIPVIKRHSHLPVIVDPSHATGHWYLVEPMAKAAIAAGSDGLIIEVHNNPAEALCDGAQSVEPKVFAKIMTKLTKLAELEDREI